MGSVLRFISGVFGRKTPAKAEKRFASALRFPDRVVFHSELQTPFGHFASEPFRVVGLDAGPEVVAAAVMEVVNASRESKEMPGGKEMQKWFAERMGVKSQAALQRGTLSVGVEMTGGMITFSATHNGGTSGDGKGFRPIEGASVAVAVGASAGEISGALGRAFGLCTSVYA